jgi:hypothetical protein
MTLPPGVAGEESALLGRVAVARKLDASTVIRAVVGFVVLFVLAYAAGHPKVTQLERRLRIGHLTAAGLPFFLLGYVAALPSIGVLTPDILREIAPLLPLGLGWIGFVVGTRFESARFADISPESEASVFLTTAVPMALIFGACALVVYPFGFLPGSTRGLVRDGLLLSRAGAMGARNAPFLARYSADGTGVPPARLIRIIELEQLAGVVGLLLISAFYRPQGAVVGWQLPGTAWLFMTLGIGTALGLLIWATLTRMHSANQFAAVLLGAVCFTAGMASFLRLSSLSVCFIAGALIINLGGSWKVTFQGVLERMERPVYFLFLVLAGAWWIPWDYRGWVLMLLFVAGRGLAKRLSARFVQRYWVKDLTETECRVLAHAPMGALSVAIVVSAWDLYSGPTVPLIVTAIIGGSVLSEVIVQWRFRQRASQAAEPAQETAA